MLQVKEIDIRLFNMRTRLPFRYGIVTVRACPHLFMKLTLEIDGQLVSGISADHLPPKWFTKNPQTPFEDDLKDMIGLIRHAADHAVLAGRKEDVYSLVSSVYQAQRIWGLVKGFAPLLYNHGVSLVERACMEAFCRAKHTTFARAVRENIFGIRFSGYPDERLMLDYQELGDSKPAQWLPKAPLRRIIARHTVGLVDYLTDDEIPASERVDDGLPQSLESCIRHYGLSHFKLKIAGDVEKDLERLKRIFAVILRNARDADWRYSLDGNENYQQIGPFRQLWDLLRSDDTLRVPLSHLLFIEQPLHRDVALSDGVKGEMMAWKDRPPIIIDESDGEIGSLQRALECGYVGTSHKNCKGVIKGIANACLIEKHRRDRAGEVFMMSGEDLSNVGPVALLQDLAVSATLGIESIERNSQHYFRGLSMHSPELQEHVLRHHGDLFERHPAGFTTARIVDGRMEVGSTMDAPLGVGFEVDVSGFSRVGEWRFDLG